MLIRLLIYIILGTVLYRVARSWFGHGSYGGSRGRANSPEQVDDVMIKDPFCGAYFPRRSAVPLVEPHQTLYFCSTECRDSYRTEKS